MPRLAQLPCLSSYVVCSQLNESEESKAISRFRYCRRLPWISGVGGGGRGAIHGGVSTSSPRPSAKRVKRRGVKESHADNGAYIPCYGKFSLHTNPVEMWRRIEGLLARIVGRSLRSA